MGGKVWEYSFSHRYIVFSASRSANIGSWLLTRVLRFTSSGPLSPCPFEARPRLLLLLLNIFLLQFIRHRRDWCARAGSYTPARSELHVMSARRASLVRKLSWFVYVYVLDLHEGAHGGQSAGVHHAGLAAIRRLQQRRPPQPARVLHSLPWVTSLHSSRRDIQSSKAGDLSSKSVLEPVLQPQINTWLPSSLSAQAHD